MLLQKQININYSLLFWFINTFKNLNRSISISNAFINLKLFLLTSFHILCNGFIT